MIGVIVVLIDLYLLIFARLDFLGIFVIMFVAVLTSLLKVMYMAILLEIVRLNIAFNVLFLISIGYCYAR